MNKNKVLLMYFSVFMGSLSAVPDNGLSENGPDNCSIYACLKKFEKLKPNIPSMDLSPEAKILVEACDTIISPIIPIIASKIQNVDECSKGYAKLLHILKSAVDPEQEKYNDRLEQFFRFVTYTKVIEFMNDTLTGIKKDLTDGYNKDSNLDYREIRTKFYKIQEIYYSMHLKVHDKLNPEYKEYEEKITSLPHCQLGKYDNGFKAKWNFYRFYADYISINTCNLTELKTQIAELQRIWKTILTLFPHSFVQREFKLDMLEMIKKAKGSLNDMPFLTLLEWEMQGIYAVLLSFENLPKIILQRAIETWSDKVQKMKADTPYPNSQDFHEKKEGFKTKLKPDTDGAVQIINYAFELQKPELWPLILKLMIHVVDANDHLGDETLYDFLAPIQLCPRPQRVSYNQEDILRRMDRHWLQKLIKQPSYDQALQEKAKADITTLQSLLTCGFCSEYNEYRKTRIRWTVGIIREGLNHSRCAKVTPEYKDIFDLEYNDDRLIRGETHKILGLKS